MPVVLVTAGPTREHLDDVRFLSNASTGRMGYAVAEAAHDAGCDVVLVTGPTVLKPPTGAEVVRVVSAMDMLAACEREFPRCDLLFAVAAVADHRPKDRAAGKPPKDRAPRAVELVPNPDIVGQLAARKGRRVVVGFSLDSAARSPAEQRARARDKLARKHLDLIVVNDARAMGGEDAPGAVVLDATGGELTPPAGDKPALARWLVDLALERWRGRGA